MEWDKTINHLKTEGIKSNIKHNKNFNLNLNKKFNIITRSLQIQKL